MAEKNSLIKEYDFKAGRSKETLYFISEHEVVAFSNRGKQKAKNTFQLFLKVEPGANDTAFRFTCEKVTITRASGAKTSIPALEGWSYIYDNTQYSEDGLDSEGIMYGIPHSRFEGLVDSNKKKISIDDKYQIYSSFMYYHGYCSGLGEEGAKDLKKIGDFHIDDYTGRVQKINLGKEFLKGSEFYHGNIKRVFDGVTVIDGAECAIFSFEEKGGAYKMFIQAMPALVVKTTGGTHHSGRIYFDTQSLWAKKAVVTVVDMTTTTMFGIPVDISNFITSLTITSVSKDEF